MDPACLLRNRGEREGGSLHSPVSSQRSVTVRDRDAGLGCLGQGAGRPKKFTLRSAPLRSELIYYSP
jgi:hypothetical protein